MSAVAPFRPYVSAATTHFGLYIQGESGSKGAGLVLSRVAMAQHFLLSAAARSLSLAKVMRMSDTGVENVFLRLRWPDTGGKPVCPDCSPWRCSATR
jgi:hypothetical protein